ELLVRVVREPQAEGSESEKQQALDVRIAAARALRHYNQQPAVAALAEGLKKDKDVALRDRAHEALQAATGVRLPPDDKGGDDMTQPGAQGIVQRPEPGPIEWVRGWFEAMTDW